MTEETKPQPVELTSQQVIEMINVLRGRVTALELEKVDMQVAINISEKTISAYVDKYGPLENE